MNGTMNTLGNDSWANECRATIRKGLRERNFIDYGGLTVGRINANIIVSDGGWNEYPITYSSEAEAVMEFQRITSGLDNGKSITELLPGVELPVEIATAYVN